MATWRFVLPERPHLEERGPTPPGLEPRRRSGGRAASRCRRPASASENPTGPIAGRVEAPAASWHLVTPRSMVRQARSARILHTSCRAVCGGYGGRPDGPAILVKMSTEIQGSLFEENYLVRSVPAGLTMVSDVALTELVANAWDAGATNVEISIPEEHDDWLIVKDNGAGLTKEEFGARWMTLGYDRLRHQGQLADQPPKWQGGKRRAFGRNGVGRHGLLCFADEYEVETKKNGTRVKVLVRTSSGDRPLEAEYIEQKNTRGTGTKLRARVTRNLPNADRVRRLISARFVHDPSFTLTVNGERLDLFAFSNDDRQYPIVIEGEERGKLHVIDGDARSHRLFHHGVAFWVNRRLVGTPGWQVGDDTLLDGRIREARKYTFVVEADVLVDDVQSDWTTFKPTEAVEVFLNEVARVARDVLHSLMSVRIEEKKQDAVRGQADRLRELSRTARADVSRIVETVAQKRPTMKTDDLQAVVEAAVELETSRSGKRLLQRLVTMPEEDLAALDQLLDEWTVQDARAVLDEIDRRLSTAEAIVKLCDDPTADELHTLHPLVTQARWLFGPEYDSPIYASNRRLKTAVEKVLGPGVPPENIPRPLVRPDLLVAADATYSAVAAEDFDNGKPLSRLRRVLLIELKKGGSKIGRDEMNQANGYVEDILNCGHLDGPPLIDAFVVGHRVEAGTAKRSVSVGGHTLGNIEAVSFAHLVDTANARLFRLREQLEDRYGSSVGEDLVAKVLAEPSQLNFGKRSDSR